MCASPVSAAKRAAAAATARDGARHRDPPARIPRRRRAPLPTARYRSTRFETSTREPDRVLAIVRATSFRVGDIASRGGVPLILGGWPPVWPATAGAGLPVHHIVGEGGLEPPRPCGHRNLNPPRLPNSATRPGEQVMLTDSAGNDFVHPGSVETTWDSSSSSVVSSAWSRGHSPGRSAASSSRSSSVGV